MDAYLNSRHAKQPHTVIVVGDYMLDVVIAGTYTKFANEAPIPVFNEHSITHYLGGSGNVAANLTALGLQVIPVGMCGTDTAGTHLREKFAAANLPSAGLFTESSRPTTTKTRYYSSNTLVARMDSEITTPITVDTEDKILQYITTIIHSHSAPPHTLKVVLSDYNKGCLTTRLRGAILDLAKSHSIATFVDPKAPLSEYRGATVIKPNLSEARRLGGISPNSTLQAAHTQIAELTGCEWSLITLADQGMSLGNSTVHTHRNAEDPVEVIDVTGAGDVVLSTITALWGRDLPPARMLDIANALARISVSHRGTYVIRPCDLVRVFGITKDSPPTKETVVFTNGCFDILHVGHLNLLKYAKSLGTHLIVGLNSDASVHRLKGPTRPIRSETERAEMLRALPWVDEVRIFDEDTPERLLSEVRPAILVKGGDYTAESVLGKEYADEVRIFPFVAGQSTTSIVAAMKEKHHT
jgi:D-beta-D-heptose 7-phosphate kinase / D-beta-D-heptose 1-phosphate adenosyltransferase